MATVQYNKGVQLTLNNTGLDGTGTLTHELFSIVNTTVLQHPRLNLPVRYLGHRGNSHMEKPCIPGPTINYTQIFQLGERLEPLRVQGPTAFLTYQRLWWMASSRQGLRDLLCFHPTVQHLSPCILVTMAWDERLQAHALGLFTALVC